MKYRLIALFLLVFSLKGYCQDIQLLSSFTNKSYQITNIIEKDLNSKWDYFSLSEVGSTYKNIDSLQFETNQYFNYNLKNNFALTTGLGLQNDNILPQLGLSYAKENDKWSYAFYPTLYYGISDEQFGTSLNSVIEFSSAIKQDWDFFSLALLDFDYAFGENLTSQQNINIGFQYKKRFQFGASIDLEQDDNFKENEIGYGLFLGVNF